MGRIYPLKRAKWLLAAFALGFAGTAANAQVADYERFSCVLDRVDQNISQMLVDDFLSTQGLAERPPEFRPAFSSLLMGCAESETSDAVEMEAYRAVVFSSLLWPELRRRLEVMEFDLTITDSIVADAVAEGVPELGDADKTRITELVEEFSAETGRNESLVLYLVVGYVHFTLQENTARRSQGWN